MKKNRPAALAEEVSSAVQVISLPGRQREETGDDDCDDDGDHCGGNDRYDDGDDADKVIAVLLTLRMTAKSMMRL